MKIGKCTNRFGTTVSKIKNHCYAYELVWVKQKSYLNPQSQTFMSPQLVPSSAGCDVHVYRSLWQCKSLQISFNGWILDRILSLPYLSIHCWSASKRSPGNLPSAAWSSDGSCWPRSNMHFAWLVLQEKLRCWCYFRWSNQPNQGLGFRNSLQEWL